MTPVSKAGKLPFFSLFLSHFCQFLADIDKGTDSCQSRFPPWGVDFRAVRLRVPRLDRLWNFNLFEFCQSTERIKKDPTDFSWEIFKHL